MKQPFESAPIEHQQALHSLIFGNTGESVKNSIAPILPNQDLARPRLTAPAKNTVSKNANSLSKI